MRKSLYSICFLVMLATVSSVSSGASGCPDQLYGAGAHALFAGQYPEAIAMFDKAESQGVCDPRCFFLRGLAQRRLGNMAAAEADMQRGAALEWSEPLGNFNVNQALARVQGPERLQIEQARNAAKEKWQQAERQRQLARYGEVVRQERAYIQTQLMEKHAGPIQPLDTTATLPFGAMSIHPFRVVRSLTDPITWSKPRQDSSEIAEGIRTAGEKQALVPLEKPARVSTKQSTDVADPFGVQSSDDPFGGDDDPFGSVPQSLPMNTGGFDDPFSSPAPSPSSTSDDFFN